MKNIFPFLIFIAFFGCSSQKANRGKTELGFATTENDSLKTEIKDFTENHILELITILPKCETRGYPKFSEDGTERIGRETVEYCDYETIIKKNKTGHGNGIVELKNEYVGQKIKLKKSDYGKLFRIMDKKPSETIVVISDYYIPRHGLNFYDSKLDLIGFLEICFECNRIETAGEVPLSILSFGEEMSNLKKVYAEYNLLENN